MDGGFREEEEARSPTEGVWLDAVAKPVIFRRRGSFTHAERAGSYWAALSENLLNESSEIPLDNHEGGLMIGRRLLLGKSGNSGL